MLRFFIAATAAVFGPPAFSESIAQQVYNIFVETCASCHGPNSPGKGGFSKVLDFAALRQSGTYVKPGRPEDSLIQTLIDSDEMPARGRLLTTVEKELVRTWIREGALDPERPLSPEFDLEATLEATRRHMATLPERTWSELRVIVFPPALSDGGRKPDVNTQALAKFVNSVSLAQQPVRPTLVPGQEGVAYLINVQDLEWLRSGAIQAIENETPYLSYESPAHTALKNMTESESPFFFGDWLLTRGSTEPLYTRILGIGRNLNDLEARLGVDRLANINALKVKRAGFVNSGVALHNRLIERHPLWGGGAYWISYDFRSSNGSQNILENPFGPRDVNHNSFKRFDHAGGEIIYHLPNGFFGYKLTDGRGNALDLAPVDIVSDSDPRRPVVTNAVSCMSCHGGGLRKNNDIVRDYVLRAQDFDQSEKDMAEELYPPANEMAALIDRDNRRYLDALAAAGVSVTSPDKEPVNQIAYFYGARVSLDSAATYFGVTGNLLHLSLKQDESLKSFGERLKRAGVAREELESRAGEIIHAVKQTKTRLDQVRQISASGSHTCARLDMDVLCWGTNSFGQLNVPAEVLFAKSIASGFDHNCALIDDRVICWGRNDSGQSTPPPLSRPTLIAAGGAHTCALDATGVKCWGNNDAGQTNVPNLRGVSVTKLSLGQSHSCALGNKVVCWGSNRHGQATVPADLEVGVIDISAGKLHTCAITRSKARCWGSNTFGQLNVPRDFSAFTQISSGHRHSCAISEDQGQNPCWGASQPTSQTPASQIVSGQDFSCWLKEFRVGCDGLNPDHQLDVPQRISTHTRGQ